MARTKPHPADLYAAQQIARATAWVAVYSAGRDGTVRRDCPSAEDAIATAGRLTRERGRFGRQALAYAITPEGNAYPIGSEGYRRPASTPETQEAPMSKQTVIARKANADRSALRATARTGQPHTIEAVPGGYVVRAVAPAKAAAAPKPAAKATLRYFAATNGKITVFRGSPTAVYRSALIVRGGQFNFSSAEPVGADMFPVTEIDKAMFGALNRLKAKRMETAPAKYATTPSDSWVEGDQLAAADRLGLDTAPAGKAAPAAKADTAPRRRGKAPAYTPGAMPTPPDFSANTHKPHRAKLARLIALVEAGDLDGLQGFAINPTSSSPKAMLRYRDRAIEAIQARG